MRIKVLKSITMLDHADVVRAGSVVESKEERNVAEYKALVAANYATETTEAVNVITGSVGGNTVPLSGIQPKAEAPANDDAADLAEILTGTAPEVIAALDSLDAAQLKQLAKLEAKGKNRTGVQDAIAAAREG